MFSRTISSSMKSFSSLSSHYILQQKRFSFLPFKLTNPMPPLPPNHNPDPDRDKYQQNSKDNEKINEKSMESSSLLFIIRVAVLVSLITSINQNRKSFNYCIKTQEKIVQYDQQMDEITSLICSENFRSNILINLEKGDKEIVKKSVEDVLAKFPQVQEEE